MYAYTTTKPVINFRFLWRHPANMIALGFGSGLLKAPGTMGTLLAWLLFDYVLVPYVGFSDAALFQVRDFLVLFGASLVGWWACARVEKSTQQHDNGSVVVDEIVAFWWVLWLVPNSFVWQMAAFVVFRWFDIVKPQPIRWLDQFVKGGFGVMLDDLMAAFYTLLVLAVVYRVIF